MNQQQGSRYYQRPYSINLSLNNPPLFVTPIIGWRAIYLHIEIDTKKIEYDSTQTITYLFHRKVKFTEKTKWKWTSNKIEVMTAMEYLLSRGVKLGTKTGAILMPFKKVRSSKIKKDKNESNK